MAADNLYPGSKMHYSLALSAASCPILPFPKTLIPNFKTSKLPSPKSHIFKSVTLHCTSPIQVADLVEEDYSFLENRFTLPQHSLSIVVSKISEKSKVLISFPTIGFVSNVVEIAQCELVACVHESLSVLAMIKEADDRVRCFQGGVDAVPKKFLPFDAMFVCYFPGMGVEVEELIALAKNICTQGGRLVICYDQGKVVLRNRTKRHFGIAAVDLPDKIVLENAAAKHAVQLAHFTDGPGLYLAVLEL